MSWLKEYRRALEGVPVVGAAGWKAAPPEALDFGALMLWLNVRASHALKQAATFEQQRAAVSQVLSKALDFLGSLGYDGFADTAMFRPCLALSPEQALQRKLEAPLAPEQPDYQERLSKRKSSGSTNRSSVTTKTTGSPEAAADESKAAAPSFEDASELIHYSAMSSDIETPLIVQHDVPPAEAQSAGALLSSQFAVTQIWPERSLNAERKALRCNIYTHPVWGDPGVFCYGTDPRRVLGWHKRAAPRASLEAMVFDYRAPAPPTPVRQAAAKRRRTAASEKSELRELLNRLRVASGWTAYAWFVLCRRPELEDFGLKGNDIMSICGAEWEDLQRGAADRLRTWLLNILAYAAERPVPAEPPEIRAYKARIRHHLASPFDKQPTPHAQEKLRGAGEAS